MNITFKSIRITFANLAEMQELLLFVQKMNIRLIPEFDETGQIIQEKKYPKTLQKLIDEKEDFGKHIDLKPEKVKSEKIEPIEETKPIHKKFRYKDKKCISCGKEYTPMGCRQQFCDECKK